LPVGVRSARAVTWAIGQLRREHATIAGLARQLRTSWKTLWRAIKPELQRLAADETRFAGVHSLGVDEHIWHHVDPRRRGPKELTGMVDLSRDGRGRVRARLLDLVPGRSKKAYQDWLSERGEAFRQNVQVAALDPSAGYKSAIDDQLERSWTLDTVAVVHAVRNRAAHHEPFSSGFPLPGQQTRLSAQEGHQACSKLAGLLDRDLAAWLAGNSSVSHILAARPGN
jgi:transposase